jgi:hypothetical protein
LLPHQRNLNHHQSQTAVAFAEPKPPTTINLILSSRPIAHKMVVSEPLIVRGMSEHEVCISGTSQPK